MILNLFVCYVCVFCGVAAFSHEGDNPILNLAHEAEIILYHISIGKWHYIESIKGKKQTKETVNRNQIYGIHVRKVVLEQRAKEKLKF